MPQKSNLLQTGVLVVFGIFKDINDQFALSRSLVFWMVEVGKENRGYKGETLEGKSRHDLEIHTDTDQKSVENMSFTDGKEKGWGYLLRLFERRDSLTMIKNH